MGNHQSSGERLKLTFQNFNTKKKIWLAATTILTLAFIVTNLASCSLPFSQPSGSPTPVNSNTSVSTTRTTQPTTTASLGTITPSQTVLPSNTSTGTPSPSTTVTNTPQKTSTPMPTPLAQNTNANWSLVFGDDFNNDHLDINKWTTCYWWVNHGCTNPGNREMEWYQPNNVAVHNKVLDLIAEKRTVISPDGKQYQYTSGMVTTGRDSEDLSHPVRFSFQYGFVEIRAKVPSGNGIWPAFWMLPADNTSLPEIDVMEVVGTDPKTVIMTFHYKGSDGAKAQKQDNWIGNTDLSQDFHAYGVDWEPDHISWYVDGVERFRVDDPAIIPKVPMYLILNLAVGGYWVGYPDGTTNFPSTFSIDYVRVWKNNANSN